MKQTREGNVPWSPDSETRYTRNRIARARPENQPILRTFAEWLGTQRGLAPATVTLRVSSACSFVDALTTRAGESCAETFRSLSASEVEDFFVHYGRDHGIAARRSMSTAVRAFLQFAVSHGWVGRELIGAVPRLRSYQLESLPRGLSDEELATLLATPWDSGECPLRDRAIVYLLATYGVRRQQVSGLKLVDIDWDARTIGFQAHKGGKAVLHALSASVAEAIAQYLQIERPVSDREFVFLRHPPPHLRLSPSAISAAVRMRMVRCGLPPRHPHALRHTFATRLLRTGHSTKAIADLLGHRSLGSVSVYAKVDHPRLLEVAGEWPEVVS